MANMEGKQVRKPKEDVRERSNRPILNGKPICFGFNNKAGEIWNSLELRIGRNQIEC